MKSTCGARNPGDSIIHEEITKILLGLKKSLEKKFNQKETLSNASLTPSL